MTAEAKIAAFAVRLDAELLQSPDKLAGTTERSRNWLVARAAGDHVALNHWQTAKIEAAIAVANRGDFASVEELARVRDKFAARG